MPDPLDWLDDGLADLDRRNLRRRHFAFQSPQRGDRIVIDGQSLVSFGSNDYLGLAADPRITAVVRAVLDDNGWGAAASPLITGRSSLHAELERELAAFEGTEAALLFPTGYAANVGAITALIGKGDAVYSDALNHASIIDGCRLSGATIHVYRHRDLAHLQQLLSESQVFRRRLLVTDSLFSMYGDFAPLADLAELAVRFNLMFMVDEAHATGIYGAFGRGRCDEEGVDPQVHLKIGTMSKALGGMGGFAAGSRRAIDWLVNRARPYIFSTAAPPAMAAAGLAALAIVNSRADWRTELLAKADMLRKKLRACGLDIGDSESQIVPVKLGDAQRVMAAAEGLRHRGFFVPAIRPPSVPEGQSLLRISLTALHTGNQLEELAGALVKLVR